MLNVQAHLPALQEMQELPRPTLLQVEDNPASADVVKHQGIEMAHAFAPELSKRSTLPYCQQSYTAATVLSGSNSSIRL